jgi:AcrR family transcriptional regulator
MPVKRETSPIRRKQIVDAARKLIITRGSEHITIKGLAHEVGISEAAIYRHFNEKRDVLLFLADDIGINLLCDIDDTEDVGEEILDKLDGIIKKHISAIEQRRGVSFQVIAEIISMGDSGLNARVSEIVERYIASLTVIFERAISRGEVKPNLDAGASAALVFGMTQGVVDLWALSNYSFDLEKRYNDIWSTFRQAIVAEGKDNSL